MNIEYSQAFYTSPLRNVLGYNQRNAMRQRNDYRSMRTYDWVWIAIWG